MKGGYAREQRNMEQSVFTVSRLNRCINDMLRSNAALRNVRVSGELSNYKAHPSGHHYFTLKDDESCIKCVMFRSDVSKLRFRPDNGMSVVATGRVEVFMRDGVHQLYCTSMQPQGLGELYAAYEKLKARLDAEGLFDNAHKKPLPRFPGRIALITSDSGAAVRDMIRVTGRRWPMAKLLVMSVRVQGAEAPAEIVSALNYANRHRLADLIITGRGGGSIEDLWAFNDENVARAIYASEIPVISAVGHEPDKPISDYVADRPAATPSNGAEMAVPDQMKVRDELQSFEIRANQAVRKELEALRRTLTQLSQRRVIQSPTGYMEQKRMELDYMSTHLVAAAEKTVAAARREQVRLAAALDALSPLKVLSRGYACAVNGSGAAVSSVSSVETGELLSLRLSDGELGCRVEEKRERTVR